MELRPTPERSARAESLQGRHRTGLLTLLFTDIIGSTRIKQQLGDQAGVTAIRLHHALVRELLAQFAEAHEVDTAGDSFFLVFVNPSDAVRFALLLQARLRTRAEESVQPVLDRIGIHIGEVIIEQAAGTDKPRHLSGAQVDLCARVMSMAAPDQILLTRSAFDNARQALRGEELLGFGELAWLNHGFYAVKGVEEPLEVCEVGERGRACLRAPVDGERAQHQDSPASESELGWRPARGQPVPRTQWILERKLGEGGFGEVWLGRHQTMKERRVFKFCFRADRVRYLKREMTLFRLVKERVGAHPNIVRLLDVHFDRPPFYVEMDYVEGEDLRACGATLIPMDARLEIVAQVADALQAAHEAGVIHRDVKPANILIANVQAADRTGNTDQRPVAVKLTDFGIGQVLSDEYLAGITRAGFTRTVTSSTSTSHTGTQLYMAPELLAGKPASARSDIYSLGVVLYQLLVGDLRLPLTTDWHGAIVDPLLRDDLERCFAGQPEERFARAGDLAANLRSLPQRRIESARLEAALAHQAQRVHRWRRFRMVGVGAVMGLLALAVAGFYYRTSKVRWAREVAIPRATQWAEAKRMGEGLELAIQAARFLPKDDPALTHLLGLVSDLVTIETVPPGADIHARDYRSKTTNWSYLGKAPIAALRMPRLLYRWQFRKTGHVTVEKAFEPKGQTHRITLDAANAIPAGMIRVGGTNMDMRLTGLGHLGSVWVDDYLIDRFEVTNREYYDFVARGGYAATNHWKQPFFRDGKAIAWSEAMQLFRDRSGQPGPLNWIDGRYAKGTEEYPVSGVSWYEAAAYADFAGKSLPSIFHWNAVASIFHMASDIIPLSNFGSLEMARVGAYAGMGDSGTYDMAGNAREWCWNESAPGKRYILGGSWSDPSYMFYVPALQSPFERAPTYGFRCVKSLSSTPLSKAVTGPVPAAFRDYAAETPVGDEIFRIYKSSFTYDKTALNTRVERVDENSADWRMEKVSFNAAYGNERLTAYLFLPRHAPPPYQTIVHFPGSPAIFERSSDPRQIHFLNFIVESGRAVLYPIYKGTYERGDGLDSNRPAPTAFYRDHVIAWSKDLARSIDYLQTRPDIDSTKLGYFGSSWGGGIGVVLTAVESRFAVSVLHVGGFWMETTLPEVDQINYVSHVTLPTLMLSGRHDPVFPAESSQSHLFRLLGTPPQHKRHHISEAGHSIPRGELVKESLAWLDHYLGPAK